ncbi:MAG: Fic family protein [bacterium]|nr:Fic family protein [bacterium]
MNKLSQKHQKIMRIFLEKGIMQSSDIYAEMIKSDEDTSLVTIKRIVSKMVQEGILEISGAGRSTKYAITSRGRIFTDIDAGQYCAIEPDERYGMSRYNFDMLSAMPSDIFMDDELEKLHSSTTEYKRRTHDLPVSIQKKERERLIIELSWKSSKIEGNTYTLMDTEKLILEDKEAIGHSKQEARMILNHKDAFTYICQNSAQFNIITRKNLEELHAILVKDLDIGVNLRTKPVGVTGAKYLPLDNMYQISEAVESLATAVAKIRTPYAKALIALLGISYIQPFEDGNKRTGRLMANAILLSHMCAPLSYRSINEVDYKNAILVFYELNSILPMKKIFIEQYDFAARNYAVK